MGAGRFDSRPRANQDHKHRALADTNESRDVLAHYRDIGFVACDRGW
jgi:oligoribonuclease (3'-5' exoribonuclease)